MEYKLLILDIDGTLRPFSRSEIPQENVDAIQALHAHGVKIAIATGRGRGSVSESILNGLHADYWICCAGAQILDSQGQELWSCRMPSEVLAPILSFYQKREYPLFLCREKANTLFAGFEKYLLQKEDFKTLDEPPFDSDPAHAYSDPPFTCFAWMSQAAEAEFHAEFPDVPVCFYFYRGKFCDIIQKGITKASGLDRLLELTGIDLSETVFIGDGANDVALLRHAAMSFAVADGQPQAKQAAKQICPAAEAFGVAAVCRSLWPEAFSPRAGIKSQP